MEIWQVIAVTIAGLTFLVTVALIIFRAGTRHGAQEHGVEVAENERLALRQELDTFRNNLHGDIERVKAEVAHTLRTHTVEEERMVGQVVGRVSEQIGALSGRVDKLATDVGYVRGVMSTWQQQQQGGK